MQELIGRKNEVKILNHLLTSKEAEFAAVYGRRRVGKTFLIRNIINSKKHLIFELTGVKNGSLREQLSNFIDALATTFHTSLINQKIKNFY
ncbi:MAG: hypothetical protein COC15_01525 [Legionellales bacterium]|nr:MAG: hypothetical protein COC15_01525 [Legionellales bacterium]